MLVGASCVDIRLRAQLTLTGPRRGAVGGAAVEAGYRTLDDAMLAELGLEVPLAEGPTPYSENTTWGELGKSGWLGWLVFSIALSAARREAYKNAAPKPGADPLATAALGDAATLTLILTLNPTLNLFPTPTPTPTRNPYPNPNQVVPASPRALPLTDTTSKGTSSRVTWTGQG